MKKIGELLYPHVCPFCGNVEVDEVCKKCRKKLKSVHEPTCKKCGKTISNTQTEYCRDCAERIKEKACWYEQGRSLWIHRPPASDSIYQFKFRNRRVYAEFYAKEWMRRYGKLLEKWEIEAIVPIPMNRKKKHQRGFNQAEVLADRLSELSGIPVRKDLLIRTRQTEAQKTLSRNKRKGNLERSFSTKTEGRLPDSVLLIDDIYTTGNTINEAAKALKKAGVRNAFFFTISVGQDI
ncbi:amidophosphoribosyltransferase [Drancourtella sp. An210]|nr:amidophosphoribosyltransferase [Drancourtella sp. An210]OUP64267.1 amidophosphoribosyltransferase [Drancourtella sp. An177]